MNAMNKEQNISLATHYTARRDGLTDRYSAFVCSKCARNINTHDLTKHSYTLFAVKPHMHMPCESCVDAADAY